MIDKIKLHDFFLGLFHFRQSGDTLAYQVIRRVFIPVVHFYLDFIIYDIQ